jgi:hypothetical protein
MKGTFLFSFSISYDYISLNSKWHNSSFVFHLYRSCSNMYVKFLMLIFKGLIFVKVSNLDSIVLSKFEV